MEVVRKSSRLYKKACTQCRIKGEQRGQLPRAPRSEGAPRDGNFCFKF